MPDYEPDEKAVEEMAQRMGRAIQCNRGRPEWALDGFYEGNRDDLHAAAAMALRHAHAVALRAVEIDRENGGPFPELTPREAADRAVGE